MFLDLQPLWPSPLTKPDLLTFSCSSGHVLSKTKSVTPHFFIFLTSLTHHLSMVNFLEKIKVLKKRVRTGLRARVRVGPVLACSRSRIGPGVHMLAYSRTRLLTCSYARLNRLPVSRVPPCSRSRTNVYRDLTQNTTATATRKSKNNRFEDQNSSCARAL